MNPSRHHRCLTSLLAGTLAFLSAAIVSPETAAGQSRIISLSGDLDFGRIPLRSSAQRRLTISNAGDSVLTVSNLGYPAEPTFMQLNLEGNWSGPIAPGESHDVVITFTPLGTTFLGPRDLDFQGYLSVESDATAGTNYIAMSGVGVWPSTNNLPPLDFGPVAMGAIHALTWSLTNQGDIPITISNIPSSQVFEAFFWPQLTNNMIAAGSAANFFAVFSPTNVGESRGVITISSDASEPALVAVTPNGNITNSAEGFIQIPVSGTGTYPAGKFIGLFAPTNIPRFENSGYFEAVCTAKGKFRATLTLAGKRYPFSAQTSPDGSVSATIRRKHLPALTISLKYNADRGRDWTGTIDDGTWTAALRSYQAVHLRKHLRSLGPVGSYAFTIAGSTNSLLGPTAAGSGALTIKVSNVVRIRGELGDGTRFSQNTMMVGEIPFYAPLYHNRGAVLGWIPIDAVPIFPSGPIILPPITITNVPITRPINPWPATNIPPIEIVPIEIRPALTNPKPAADVHYQIIGTLNWFKPAGIDPDYPDGFSFQTTITGSVP